MEQSQRKRIYALLNKRILTIILLFFLAVGSAAYGYGGGEHADITPKAINNYYNWVLADPDNRVGAAAVAIYQDNVASGSVDEDTIGTAPWLEHYMDPDTNLGLYIFPIRYDSAFVRADGDHWPDALYYYTIGEYALAYHTLGRVIHLVEDMGVPAHVHLDPHWHLFWIIEDPDWYESTYAPAHHLSETDTSNLDSVSSLQDIMYGLAEISDDFDSSDYDGETEAVDRSDGFSDSEGAIIANASYKGTIKSAGAVLRLFYYIVKPTVDLLRPVTQGEIHSGLIGIPFEAKAKSCNRLFSDADFIKRVDFEYAEEDAPVPADWTNACSDTTPDAEYKYTCKWNNSIDDDKVWVRAIAIDDGDCDSLLEKIWIKIDSTRPTVTNTSP